MSTPRALNNLFDLDLADGDIVCVIVEDGVDAVYAMDDGGPSARLFAMKPRLAPAELAQMGLTAHL